jgi:archaellum biogenesis ATPase FlaH
MVLTSDLREWSKPSYNYLWKKTLSLYKKTDEIVSWPVFKRVLMSSKLTNAQKQLYVSEVKKLFSEKNYKVAKKEGVLKYSVVELNAIQRTTDFFDIAKQHATAINTGDVEDIDEALEKTIGLLVTRLANKKQPDYVIVDYAEDFEQRMKERKDEKNDVDNHKKFNFRYQSLANIYKKGVRGGELFIISGATGVGKSIFSVDVAVQACEQGLNVAFITSENTIHQTCGRLDSNLTGWEYDMIQAYGFEDNGELRKFEKSFKEKLNAAKHLKVIKMSPNNFSVLTIMRALNQLKQDKGWEPQCLIIDSPDLMRPSVDVKMGENFSRVTKSLVYWEIKGMAIDNNLIVFTTAQLVRDVGKRKDVLSASAEDIADSYDKVRIADNMLILLETIELAIENKIAMKIGKNRDGAKPVEPVIMRADKARMRFYDEFGDREEYDDEAEDERDKRASKKKRKKKVKFVN